MDGSTAIGPAEPPPSTGHEDASDRAVVEGVDALDANEFDMRHGLAGAEARLVRGKPGKDTRAAEVTPLAPAAPSSRR